MLVAGANDLSPGLQGSFEDSIIVWVRGDNADVLLRMNDGSDPRDLIDRARGSLARPAELVREDPCELGQ